MKRPLAFLMSVLMILTFSFSDGLLGLSSLVYADDASAPAGDGSEANPYLIEDYADLVWFQEQINSNSISSNLSAKLTADIVANEDLLDESGAVKGSPDKIWTPICQDGSRDDVNGKCSFFYAGTFDGNGHFISGLYCNSTNENVGLFGNLNGTVKNLSIIDSYFGGTSYVGSFAGCAYADSKIINCGSNASVNGSDRIAGIAGALAYGSEIQEESYDSSLNNYIKDCYYIGKISETSTNKDAISCTYEWTSVYADFDDIMEEDFTTYPQIFNCYFSADCGASANNGGTSKTSSEISAGSICEGVNFHTYKGGKCLLCKALKSGEELNETTTEEPLETTTEEPTETTTEEPTETTTKAGKPENGDGSSSSPFEIKTYANLEWFKWFVENEDLNANAKLVDDIIANENLLDDLFDENGALNKTPEKDWLPITSNVADYSDTYNGTFNGNGHFISGLYCNRSESYESYVGLFGEARGTIKNLVIKDSYFAGLNYVGSFVGQGYECTISNCGSNAQLKASSSYYGYTGGIVGCMSGYVNNCYYAGSITSESPKNAIANDSYSSPSLPTNCYYSSSCGASSEKATSKAIEAFSTGEICFLLNKGKTDGTQTFYQSLGTDGDAYPVLIKTDNNTVYKGYDSDNKQIIYSNTPYSCGENHIYENGVCQICDAVQSPDLKDNYYQIANYGNLVWFQRYVDNGNKKANAKLINDIIANEDLVDLSTEELKNVNPKYTWTPIFKEGNVRLNDITMEWIASSYTGTFDGDRHFISGLYCNDSTANTGLFGTSTGLIKNVTIIDSYFSGSTNVGSLVGVGYDDCQILNCGSNAVIKKGYNSAGILGKAGENSTPVVSNCFYIGKISSSISSSDKDAIAGKGSSSDASAEICYFPPEVLNCYYSEDCGASANNGGTPKTSSEIADGSLCESVEFHTYKNGKCLLCESKEMKIVPIHNFEYSADNNLWTVFSVQISDEIVNTADSSIKITLPNETEETYSIKDADNISLKFNGDSYVNITFGSKESINCSITDAEKAMLQNIGVSSEEATVLYVFPCNVEPWELTKDVKAEVIANGNSVKEFTFSVKENIEKELIDNSETISALLKFGASAQKYFDYNTSNLANSGIADTTDNLLDDDTIDYLKEEYSKTMASNEKIGTFTGLDAVLGAKVTLNAYFKPADGVDISDLTFKIGEKTVEPTKAGDKYILSAENIGIVDAIYNSFNFKISDSQNNELTLTNCSMQTYFGGVFTDKNNEYEDSLKKLLSNYCTYATTIFATRSH